MKKDGSIASPVRCKQEPSEQKPRRRGCRIKMQQPLSTSLLALSSLFPRVHISLSCFIFFRVGFFHKILMIFYCFCQRSNWQKPPKHGIITHNGIIRGFIALLHIIFRFLCLNPMQGRAKNQSDRGRRYFELRYQKHRPAEKSRDWRHRPAAYCFIPGLFPVIAAPRLFTSAV